jgi:hypothetical protein
MSVVEDVRTVIQDFLAPELRELKERVIALEKRMEDRFEGAERAAQIRQDQVMLAIKQLADYTTLAQRISRLESREASN